MIEIMPVPRNLILLSYQQRALQAFFFAYICIYIHFYDQQCQPAQKGTSNDICTRDSVEITFFHAKLLHVYSQNAIIHA